MLGFATQNNGPCLKTRLFYYSGMQMYPPILRRKGGGDKKSFFTMIIYTFPDSINILNTNVL